MQRYLPLTQHHRVIGMHVRYFSLSKNIPNYLKEQPVSEKQKSTLLRRQRQALLGASLRGPQGPTQGPTPAGVLSRRGTTGANALPFRKKTGFRSILCNRWDLRRQGPLPMGRSPRRFFATKGTPWGTPEIRARRIQEGNQRMQWNTRRGMNFGNRALHRRRLQGVSPSFSSAEAPSPLATMATYLETYAIGAEVTQVRRGRRFEPVAHPRYPRRRIQRSIRRRRKATRTGTGRVAKTELLSVYLLRIQGKGPLRKARGGVLENIALSRSSRKKQWWPKGSL